MKKIITLCICLMLSLTLAGCEKEEVIKVDPEKLITPDRDFSEEDTALVALVTRCEDDSIHDFYVLEDNVELTFSKVDVHNFTWYERTEDVTDKYFEKRVFNKGDKGTFVCNMSVGYDAPKYILDARSLDDGTFNSWLSTFYDALLYQTKLTEDFKFIFYKRNDYELDGEIRLRMDPIRRAVAISRYMFGDMWGLAETGGAATGGDVETDGRLYWKAVAFGVYETRDCLLLDENGEELTITDNPHRIRSVVCDGDTLDDVRHAMFELDFYPEDTEGVITKLSKDRFELAIDPEYFNYYADEMAFYVEKPNETKFEYEVGLEGPVREFGSYVTFISKFDIDNKCTDYLDFYNKNRFPDTIIDAELVDAVG